MRDKFLYARTPSATHSGTPVQLVPVQQCLEVKEGILQLLGLVEQRCTSGRVAHLGSPRGILESIEEVPSIGMLSSYGGYPDA